jgi:hypothetical protein
MSARPANTSVTIAAQRGYAYSFSYGAWRFS